jgi:hypothetical protein
MPKQVIAYNLADGVTKAEYQKYVDEKKGPFFVNLPAVKGYTLLEIVSESSPFQYVAFVDTDDPAGLQKDTQSPAFGEFLKEWMPKVKDVTMMFGMEAFAGSK